MENLAYKISAAIKRTNPEETSSVEVMQYALSIILNTLIIILSSAFIGLLLHHFGDTMIFFFSFAILRVCSGGFHLKTARACNIVTILLCTLTPYVFTIDRQTGWIMNSFCLLVMLFFAPNPDRNAQIPHRWYPGLKLLSLLLIGVNFLIGSSVIGLAYFVQSLTVIPWKRRVKP